MDKKINQLKIDISGELDKVYYYNAFNFLNVRPLFKTQLFEYFDFDIKRAWEVDQQDLILFSEDTGYSVPREFLSKKAKIDLKECYEKAFADKEVKILTFEDDNYPALLKEIPDFPLALYYKGDLFSRLLP